MDASATIPPLTTRQQALLEFGLRYQRVHGCPPTRDEMAADRGSHSTVRDDLHALERHGLVRHRPGTARCWWFVDVPVVASRDT